MSDAGLKGTTRARRSPSDIRLSLCIAFDQEVTAHPGDGSGKPSGNPRFLA
jgi:hypothetical protein